MLSERQNLLTSAIVAPLVEVNQQLSLSDFPDFNDPTCGSGSLLLKVTDEANSEVTIYGQEKDATTNDPQERFKHFGTPPDKQGDYAYLLHILRSLKPSTGSGRGGKGA